jgi:hypothetical protein
LAKTGDLVDWSGAAMLNSAMNQMKTPASARWIALLWSCALIAALDGLALPTLAGNPYGRWTNGPPHDENFFPICVWLQQPFRAAQYRAAGINTYVALWDGLTEEELAALGAAGMKLVCIQNEVGLKHLNDPTIIAWMHGDEPDNGQDLPGGKGYGPPILPEKTIAEYNRMRAADPSRPVLLNLGQGVAWDDYIGRIDRRNHPEDYPEYVKGSDIDSFDIYPVVHDDPAVAGKLWYVPQGVSRLVQWAGPDRVVWNCIECTHINNPNRKATPEQVRSEVWMSLIHGSRGLIYFVHQFQPSQNEAAIFLDPEMVAAVTVLNHQITQLAPVLNQDTVTNGAKVVSEKSDVPIDTMVKKKGDALYVFAVAMRDGQTTGTFTLPNLTGDSQVEVLNENRSLPMQNGVFHDFFKPWEPHIYKVTATPAH